MIDLIARNRPFAQGARTRERICRRKRRNTLQKQLFFSDRHWSVSHHACSLSSPSAHVLPFLRGKRKSACFGNWTPAIGDRQILLHPRVYTRAKDNPLKKQHHHLRSRVEARMRFDIQLPVAGIAPKALMRVDCFPFHSTLISSIFPALFAAPLRRTSFKDKAQTKR